MLKNKYATYFSLLCALSFGCQQKKNVESESQSLAFDTINADTTVHIFNDSTYPKCIVEISMEYVAKAPNEELQKSLDKFVIQSTLGDKYGNLDIKSAVAEYMNEFIEDYKDIENYIEDNDSSELMSASNNYDNVVESKLVYKDQNLLSLCKSGYVYTGGAHGSSAQINSVYDLRKGKIVSLNDIFNEGSYPELGNMIVEQIKTDKGYTDISELYDEGFFSIDEIYPTENFFVNTDGITWVYVPYEIASYATGQTTVFLPWSKVSEYTIKDSPIAYLIKTIN